MIEVKDLLALPKKEFDINPKDKQYAQLIACFLQQQKGRAYSVNEITEILNKARSESYLSSLKRGRVYTTLRELVRNKEGHVCQKGVYYWFEESLEKAKELKTYEH